MGHERSHRVSGHLFSSTNALIETKDKLEKVLEGIIKRVKKKCSKEGKGSHLLTGGHGYFIVSTCKEGKKVTRHPKDGVFHSALRITNSTLH